MKVNTTFFITVRTRKQNMILQKLLPIKRLASVTFAAFWASNRISRLNISCAIRRRKWVGSTATTIPATALLLCQIKSTQYTMSRCSVPASMKMFILYHTHRFLSITKITEPSLSYSSPVKAKPFFNQNALLWGFPLSMPKRTFSKPSCAKYVTLSEIITVPIP